MDGIENFKKQAAAQMEAFEKIWDEEGNYMILGAEPHDMAAMWFAHGASWQKDQQDKELNIKTKSREAETEE